MVWAGIRLAGAYACHRPYEGHIIFFTRERERYHGVGPCVVITYVITVAHPASIANVKNLSSLSVELCSIILHIHILLY